MAARPPQLNIEEMREFDELSVGRQFFEDAGNAAPASVFSPPNIAPPAMRILERRAQAHGSAPDVHRSDDGLGAVASRAADARSDEGKEHLLAAF